MRLFTIGSALVAAAMAANFDQLQVDAPKNEVTSLEEPKENNGENVEGEIPAEEEDGEAEEAVEEVD